MYLLQPYAVDVIVDSALHRTSCEGREQHRPSHESHEYILLGGSAGNAVSEEPIAGVAEFAAAVQIGRVRHRSEGARGRSISLIVGYGKDSGTAYGYGGVGEGGRTRLGIVGSHAGPGLLVRDGAVGSRKRWIEVFADGFLQPEDGSIGAVDGKDTVGRVKVI